MSMKLVGILVGIGLVVIIGALFFFAGQAESRKPEQKEIRVPATNVGVQPEAAGGGHAPAQ
jgi:ABC-type transporter Mla subunit MlaD